MDGPGAELGWWRDAGINVGSDHESKLGADTVWGEQDATLVDAFLKHCH